MTQNDTNIDLERIFDIADNDARNNQTRYTPEDVFDSMRANIKRKYKIK